MTPLDYARLWRSLSACIKPTETQHAWPRHHPQPMRRDADAEIQ
jgi:hypothetical protein